MATLDEVRSRIKADQSEWDKWARFWTTAYGLLIAGAALLSALAAIFALIEVSKWLTASVAVLAGLVSAGFAASRPADKRRANRLARSEADILLNELMKAGADPDRAIDRLNAIKRRQDRETTAEDVSIDDIRTAVQSLTPTDTGGT